MCKRPSTHRIGIRRLTPHLAALVAAVGVVPGLQVVEHRQARRPGCASHPYGVEPISRTLAIAPSSYYAAKTRPPSARSLRDAALGETICELHSAHFSVYGVRKPWRALRRQGEAVGRDQVARLMRAVDIAGVTRTKRVRTTRRRRLASARLTSLGGCSARRRRTACGWPT